MKIQQRAMRVVIDFPVTVFGHYSDGKIFEESTRTLSVNARGAFLTLSSLIDSQKPALLTNTKTQMEVQCRIVYRKEIQAGQFEIGLEFADPLPKFWDINFPPDDWNPAERKKPGLNQNSNSALVRE
jgi:hypothetical protein